MLKKVKIIFMSLLFVAFNNQLGYAELEKTKKLDTSLKPVKEKNGVVEFIPLLQDQVREIGAIPPKPFFISPFFFYMEDKMLIKDIQASAKPVSSGSDGIQDIIDAAIAKTPITMSNVTTNTLTTGVRAGFWLFPFLNIYGMYAFTTGYTQFNVSVPAITGLMDAFNMKEKTDFTAHTYGVGLTASYGIPKVFWGVDVFTSVDINTSWTFTNLLNNSIQMYVVSPRFGFQKNFMNSLKTAIWIGGMYKNDVNLETKVSGKYNLTTPIGELATSYTAKKSPLSPWNMVAGFLISPNRYFDFILETGFINRWNINVNVSFNF